jgi:hypothetical protein
LSRRRFAGCLLVSPFLHAAEFSPNAEAIGNFRLAFFAAAAHTICKYNGFYRWA